MTSHRPTCNCHAPADPTNRSGDHAPDCALVLWWTQQQPPPYALIQECEECHRTRPGRWLDSDDGSGEWFTCYGCKPYDSEKE